MHFLITYFPYLVGERSLGVEVLDDRDEVMGLFLRDDRNSSLQQPAPGVGGRMPAWEGKYSDNGASLH